MAERLAKGVDKMKKFYLAYGSNLNARQMFYRCPTADAVGTAVIKNYELLFKGSRTGSYLTIEKCKNEYVPVAVWEVDDKAERALDRYEGYPSFYYKKEMKVLLKDWDGNKRMIQAFVYIMHEDRPLGLPSRSYVETCLEGYDGFGFNVKHIKKAISKSQKGEVE